MSLVEDVAARSTDPVCPNNRGAWRDRPNRWLVKPTRSGAKAMTTAAIDFRQWRPGPHRHAKCIAWPQSDRWSGSSMVPSMPTISTGLSSKTVHFPIESPQSARRLVACLSSDWLCRRCSTSSVHYTREVGGHRSPKPNVGDTRAKWIPSYHKSVLKRLDATSTSSSSARHSPRAVTFDQMNAVVDAIVRAVNVSEMVRS